jgi:hypothetical protein
MFLHGRDQPFNIILPRKEGDIPQNDDIYHEVFIVY